MSGTAGQYHEELGQPLRPMADGCRPIAGGGRTGYTRTFTRGIRPSRIRALRLQTVTGLWLFYAWMPGPGLMARVSAGRLGMLWLVGYAAQVALASAWMARFRFGPAEWTWRTLTYNRRQLMRREATS